MEEKEEKEIKEEIREVKEALKWLSRTSADKMYKIDSRVQKQIKKASDRMSKYIEDVEKDRRKKMQEIRYIGVEFDPGKVKQGQEEVNAALKSGFEPIRDFETAKGIIMVLGLWGESDVQLKTGH
jgi:vacuolar-type H+-ATPase subunit I/STV1